jgi:hypothetical protein
MDWWYRILLNKCPSWILYGLLLFPLTTTAQDSIKHKLSLNGYITNMQSFMFQQWKGDWISDNLIHNRLNFKWRSSSGNLKSIIEIRNRFISGESVKQIPGYSQSISSDDGVLNMSYNISNGKSYLLNSKIDRAYVDYTYNKLQITLGRQRINWGQCSVWNPNDLFNSYSFFDFDYIEKPGSDALRLQYYATSTSTVEFALKANNKNQLTSAALYRLNKWNYDIQFLGGILNNNDYVLGLGWSGNIKDAGFYGEFTYFHPKRSLLDTAGVLVFSLGSQYTFSNSLNLQAEFLYNQMRSAGLNSFSDYYNMTLSPKYLSFTTVSLMLQASYPITPLLNISLAGMYFPKLSGLFIGPSCTYSMTDNIDFSLIIQTFNGQTTNGTNEIFSFGFIRLKWNF